MVSYKYAELFQKSHVDKQLKIDIAEGLLSITNSDLYSENFELNQSICSESELKFGSCEASSVSFRIANIFTSLKNKVAQISLVLDGNYDVPFEIGKYKVYSDVPTADRRYRDVVAYDALYDVINANMADWYNNILPDKDTKITLKEFRDSFFEYFGIEQAEIELVNDDMIVEKTVDPSEISGKDILTAICEINGCFGKIGYDGKFHYIYLDRDIQGLYPANDIYPADNLFPKDPGNININQGLYKQCQYEDYIVKSIEKLQIRQEENDIGVIVPSDEELKSANSYIIEDNFLVYGKGTSELKIIANNIFSKISRITFRPFSAECVGNLCLEPGDAIRINTKYQVVNSYILQRSIKGIQSLTDTYTADGEEYYSQQVNSVSKSIIQLKGKTNVLVRTIEETRNTITDVENGLQAEIVMTASSITQTVANNSTVWYEGDIVIDLRGYGLPNDNYKAGVEYLNKIYLDKNTGYYYQCRWGGNADNPYRWEKIGELKSAEATYNTKIEQTANGIIETLEADYQTKDDMANYPTTETMKTEIEKSAAGITETISKSQKIWDTSEYSEDNLLYGYGYPDSKQFPPSENAGKKYIDQSNGKVYQVVNGVWKYEKQLILITQELSTKIEETANGISQEVSKSRVIYDTQGKTFDLYGWGSPAKNYSATDYPFKYYFDQSTGEYYQSTAVTAYEYTWTYTGKLDAIYEDYSTGYYQTEESIALKVNVGDVSNQISVEKGGVAIKSNRLTVDSDNFKLSGTGAVEATGSIKTGKEGNYAELSDKAISFYYDGSKAGEIYGSPVSGRYSGLLLSTPQQFIGLGIHGELSTAYKYVLSNGLENYSERHTFFDDVRVGVSIACPQIYLKKNNDDTSENIYLDTVTVAGIDFIRTNKGSYIRGDLQVTGTKNRIVETQNYGKVAMNAFETTGAYFSDIGSGKITEGGCYVYFDPVFAETIDLNSEYQVFLTQTSKGKIEYAEKKEGYFIVHGDYGTTFDWMVTAGQKDYQTERMEQITIDEKSDIPYDMSIFYADNSSANQSESYMAELEEDYDNKAIEYVLNAQYQENLEMEELL